MKRLMSNNYCLANLLKSFSKYIFQKYFSKIFLEKNNFFLFLQKCFAPTQNHLFFLIKACQTFLTLKNNVICFKKSFGMGEVWPSIRHHFSVN